MSAKISVDVKKLGEAICEVGNALKNKPSFPLKEKEQKMFDTCYNSYYDCIRLVSTHCLNHSSKFEFVSKILSSPSISPEQSKKIIEKHLLDNDTISVMVKELIEIVNKLKDLHIKVKKLLHACESYPEFDKIRTTKWFNVVLGAIGIAIGIVLIAVPGVGLAVATPIVLDAVTTISMVGGGILIGSAGLGFLIDGVLGTEKNHEVYLNDLIVFLNGMDKGAYELGSAVDKHHQKVDLLNKFCGSGSFDANTAAEMCKTFDVLVAAVDFALKPNSDEATFKFNALVTASAASGFVAGALTVSALTASAATDGPVAVAQPVYTSMFR